jgi:RNA polymerase sigma-70 factor (ECF subfamily)
MDEKVLVQKLKRNEPGAFKTMVELYQDRVLNTCYRFLFNREDAEDAAQEVFIEVYRSISSFREEAKLSTWVYHIAAARSIDLMRKKKRKKRFAQMKSLLGMEEEVLELPAPRKDDPLEKLEQEERMKILQEAIDSLPENQCIAFTLSKCQGIGNKEIAEIMGLTLSSVESLMHRAKKNLEKKLYQYFERDLTKRKKILFILLLILVFQLVKYITFPHNPGGGYSLHRSCKK